MSAVKQPLVPDAPPGERACADRVIEMPRNRFNATLARAADSKALWRALVMYGALRRCIRH